MKKLTLPFAAEIIARATMGIMALVLGWEFFADANVTFNSSIGNDILEIGEALLLLSSFLLFWWVFKAFPHFSSQPLLAIRTLGLVIVIGAALAFLRGNLINWLPVIIGFGLSILLLFLHLQIQKKKEL